MKSKRIRIGTLFVVFAVLILSGVTFVHAQQTNNADDSLNLLVSPPVNGLVTKPGKATTSEIKIQNKNLGTENLKISLMKFGSSDEEGTPELVDVTPTDEFVKWIHFSEDTFSVNSNEWKTVTVTIDVPNSAAFGYYYAVVFSRVGADGQIEKGKNNLLGSVASLILLDVDAPGTIRKAEVKEFTTAKKVYEFLPAQFDVRLFNSGNVHTAPRGNVFITKGGKNVALLEVNQAKGNILPQTYRKFSTEWADGSPVYKLKGVDGKVVLDKNSKSTKSLSWDGFNPGKLRLGKYQAKVVMVYDDGKGDVATEATVDFWVIPWRILGVALIVVLLVLAGLWAILRPVYRKLKTKS